MTQHTKGPWEWAIDDKWIYIGSKGYVNFRNAFAKVDFDDVDHDEAEANAKLIAAAPELLERLQEMTEHYVNLAGCGDCGNWNPEEEPQVIASRATIAKAVQS